MTRRRPNDIAPDIFRQRLLIEGFFTREIDELVIKDYLLGIAQHLGLRSYGVPVVFAPGAGIGKEANAGFDAFMPLIDSGIASYFWTGPRFVSVVLFTCMGFDDSRAIGYTRDFFDMEGELATHTF